MIGPEKLPGRGTQSPERVRPRAMWDALVAATHRLNLDSAVPLMVQGSFANAGGMKVGRAGVAVEF